MPYWFTRLVSLLLRDRRFRVHMVRLTVRDLGVVLDSELSLSPHINQLVSRCFFQLRRIKSCVKALPTEVAKAVVNSFVVTRVDYCNALLAGAAVYKLDRLQMVLNTAARLIYGLGKYDHIQHVLRDRQHGAAAS